MAEKKKNVKAKEKVTSKKSEATSNQQNTHKLLNVILVVVIIQALLSVAILFSIQTSSSQTNDVDLSKLESIEKKVSTIDNFFRANIQGYDSNQVEEPPVINTEISADDDPFIGNADAKVTVIEFSDYQCPFCRKFWTETYPQLKADYIDTGKIKYVFRDFPLNFHPAAKDAAVAANCVREQKGNEGYFQFHDIAFAEQNKQGQGTVEFNSEDISNWVSQISGLDMDKFNTCIQDPAQLAEIEKDFSDGAAAGVSGTPSFFINGKLIVGAQPYSVLKAEIEQALNN